MSRLRCSCYSACCSSPRASAGSRSACEPRRAARIEGHRTMETEMSWQTPDGDPPPGSAAQPPDAAPAPEPDAETARVPVAETPEPEPPPPAASNEPPPAAG